MSGIGHIGELQIINEFEKKLKCEIYLPLKDKGIDFIAINSKSHNTYKIQVKTSMFQKNSYFWFDIKKNRIIKNSFFIFVCFTLNRQKFNNKKYNYFVIPSEIILKWIENEDVLFKKNSNDIVNFFVYPPNEKCKNWLFKGKGKQIVLDEYFLDNKYFK